MRGLVCILRETAGLVALVVGEGDEGPGLSRVPLRELTEAEAPGRMALLESWEALDRQRRRQPVRLPAPVPMG